MLLAANVFYCMVHWGLEVRMDNVRVYVQANEEMREGAPRRGEAETQTQMERIKVQD